MGLWDDFTSGVGNYFMGPTRAARAQQNSAKEAQGLVEQYGNQALNTMGGLAGAGMQDYDNYRQNVASGAFGTDASQFQTGGYNAQQWGQGAPGFNQFQQGQDPGYQRFEQGIAPGYKGPEYSQFQRGQDPTFQKADAGNFDFDYEQSPGYQFARDEGIKGIEGRASAQGKRFTGGTDKEIAEFASGLASQDYGNQYNRARGAFEQDRGFGERQAGQQNMFNQGNYQFGTGVDVGQNQFGANYGLNNAQFGANFNQGNYQFGQNMGFQDQQGANMYGQNAFQFGQNMGNQNNMLAQNMNNANFWAGQGMNQADAQFGANFNQGANAQNYNMYNQQGQQNAGLQGGLAGWGINSQTNLANMQQGMGDSMANAALGVGNANANRAMAAQNTANPLINMGLQAGAIAAGAK